MNSETINKPKYKKTLVINIISGPGAGKSTMTADLFAKLKWEGIDCEIAPEFAKDLVWEKRYKTFQDQIYVFGKQYHRIFRLLGEVKAVITDSPILLTPIYDVEKRETLKRLVIEEYNKCYNLNFLITRKKKYNPNGRNHNKKQAVMIDDMVKKFLQDNVIPYYEVEGTPAGVGYMRDKVLEYLKGPLSSKAI